MTTTPMSNGRTAATDRRRQRVQDTITAAVRAGTPLTVSAIAHAAQVDRTFLYRHPDLLENLHTTSRTARATPDAASAATAASLQADLANANARASRLSTRVQQLENRLSQHLGQQAWHESGLGARTDIAELQATITRLEEREIELVHQLDDRQAELEAARAANRELTRALNQRG
ncbi:DUF6262 family protein [Streptomyces platensis]|uniref:DUF6262 family protein n=1 Tax=Streptomyces platensis TaxID=58346 RepID=UPI002E801497|nr:DUF6262 family protein [Streptomyces platensis]WUB84530.1 DUF6262 family protein [Streptomyces platensis]